MSILNDITGFWIIHWDGCTNWNALLSPEVVVPIDQLLFIVEIEFPPEVEEVDASVGQAATLQWR